MHFKEGLHGIKQEARQAALAGCPAHTSAILLQVLLHLVRCVVKLRAQQLGLHMLDTGAHSSTATDTVGQNMTLQPAYTWVRFGRCNDICAHLALASGCSGSSGRLDSRMLTSWSVLISNTFQ